MIVSTAHKMSSYLFDLFPMLFSFHARSDLSGRNILVVVRCVDYAAKINCVLFLNFK